MNGVDPSPSHTLRRRMLDGTTRVFLAEALIVPTGLVTAAVLTRRLGPGGYGLLVLSATVISWVEWTVTSLFARAAIKSVADVSDWHPVATTVVRLHLLLGLIAALVVVALAQPLARLLLEPLLARYLVLFALDVPCFCVAQAHRQILVGLGRFRERARASAARWIARLLLVVVLVELGFSVSGAIVAHIGASVVELLVARAAVRPRLFGPAAATRSLWEYALPLLLSQISLRVFDKLDLFALKALGATAAEAGLYGAAQTFALLPGLFAMAFSPLLLATLTQMLRGGDEDLARALACDASRVALLLLPFAALAAGAAPEIVLLVFGPAYTAAGPILALLSIGGWASIMISVATAILTAWRRPGFTAVLTVPMVPIAVGAQWVVIPLFGAPGAAAVTAAVSAGAAVASTFAVRHFWRVAAPFGTLARSGAVALAAAVVSAAWPVAGWWLVAKLATIGVAIVAGFWALGEFRDSEIAAIGALVATRVRAARMA